MGIRNQGGKNQDVTDEVDSYYESDSKRSGSAVLYGLFALVVTLIIAAGLYFGGRAVYRVVTGSGSDETTEQTGQSGDNDSDNYGADNTGGKSSGAEQQTPGISDKSNKSTSGGSGSDMPYTGDNLPATGSPTGM